MDQLISSPSTAGPTGAQAIGGRGITWAVGTAGTWRGTTTLRCVEASKDLRPPVGPERPRASETIVAFFAGGGGGLERPCGLTFLVGNRIPGPEKHRPEAFEAEKPQRCLQRSLSASIPS